jgi:hypothetical protein
MKIVYLAYFDLCRGGVLSKIRSQTKYWLSEGYDVQVLYIGKKNEDVSLFPYEKFFEFNVFLTRYLPSIALRIFNIRNVLNFLNNEKPDLVYFRHVFPFWGVSKIFSLYKTIVELNTNDISEYASKNILLSWVYPKIRARYFEKVVQIIVVSENIESSFNVDLQKKVTLLPNSYSFDLNSFLDKKEKRLKQFVFVSSPCQFWQGIDIIIELALNLPTFRFAIAGWDISDVNKLYSNIEVPNNVTLYGYCQADKLSDILSNSGYAINALAMHRKLMTHNSALKTPMYLNNNLPILTGYKETGIVGDFFCQLDFSQGLKKQHVSIIIEWVQQWENKNVDINYVYEQVSIDVIESQRLGLFENV